ncbi:hypothetical protein [Anaerosporomusa subterranea]|uniref:hypothetical protein n=1 Tax=Anaerosporomusa subterranea TaxID=1794912 RepID=UPI0012E97E9F|nr:hypothetical protein [Anaerosporomusa subterranea]
MKKVGLVGGLGPSIHAGLLQRIIDGYRVRTAGDNYPQMIIMRACRTGLSIGEYYDNILY